MICCFRHFNSSKVLAETVRPNGMKLTKVSVPFGVIGIIYEARPNVTLDVFSLCLKSGNACVLKGGSDADCTNRAIVEIIRNVLVQCFFNPDIVALLPAGHDSTAELLNARGWVDLLIPRGGRGLIDFVRQHATIPVIETGAGVCHTYFDEFGDIEKGKAIIRNAKTRRVSVCNALDCLLVHWERLKDLPEMCKALADFNVTVYADTASYEALKGSYPAELLQHATEQDYGTEYLDYKMSIGTSTSLQGAIDHIAIYPASHYVASREKMERAMGEIRKECDQQVAYFKENKGKNMRNFIKFEAQCSKRKQVKITFIKNLRLYVKFKLNFAILVLLKINHVWNM